MSNKFRINLLFFDDDDKNQRRIIDSNIVSNLSSYNIQYWLINPEVFYNVEHDHFDHDAFIEHIKELTKGNHIDIIATDWNLFNVSSYSIKGLDIIKYMLEIHPKFAKVPFVIYSANIENASKYTLDLISKSIKNAKENENITSIEIIDNILKTRIDFIKRGDYSSKIIELIRGELNLKTLIIDSFRKFGLAKVNSGNEYFDGKTLEELVSLIEDDDTKGLRFINEFIELSISHYTELNA